ncbi:MAG: molybdopterin cofactor-binding domain-containing protein, partial [Sphingomonas sp.]
MAFAAGPEHIDELGHVNNAVWVQWIQHVAIAHWNQDGHLTVWTSTQGSFTARQQTAELLQIPVSQVTVVPCEI